MQNEPRKVFKSVDEVVSTYFPKHLEKKNADTDRDPETAGKRLARELLDAIRGKLATRSGCRNEQQD